MNIIFNYGEYTCPVMPYFMASFPVVVNEPRLSNSTLILPRQHYEYDKGTELVIMYTK